MEIAVANELPLLKNVQASGRLCGHIFGMGNSLWVFDKHTL